MEFNDSFGNFNSNEDDNKIGNISFNEENNNNNISFEGNNNNENNNISFEEEKKNNISFENMDNKIISIPETNNNKNENEIFNSLPMEIQNQESEDIIYYEKLLILENIKKNISSVFNIINKRVNFYKVIFFYELKTRAYNKYSKLVCAEILFINIKTKLNIFNSIERMYRYKNLKESFVTIKRYAKIKKEKEEKEKKRENEMKKKIKEMNDLLKNHENNLKNLNENVEKLKTNEKNINTEINELNKKHNKLNDKLNELTQKTKPLKESIKKKSDNFSLTLDKTIDPKIAELQNIIKYKEREKEKSMNYFEDFFKKMNDMLGFYESNYETIKSTINSSSAS